MLNEKIQWRKQNDKLLWLDNPRKSWLLICGEQGKSHFLLVVPSVRSIKEWMESCHLLNETIQWKKQDDKLLWLNNPGKSWLLIGREQGKNHFLLVVPSVRRIGEWRAVRGLCQTKDGASRHKTATYEIGSLGAAANKNKRKLIIQI